MAYLHLDLAATSALAIGALRLLGAGGLLAGLVGHGALGLLECALDLVLDGGLAFDGLGLADATGGGRLLGSGLCCGGLGGALPACGRFADGVGGDGLEDTRLGVAGGGTGGCHCNKDVVRRPC